jgi:pyruvate-formate lyase-activating enzyme
MFARPRILTIFTTRQCTAACDHCCVGASPAARERIPLPRIHGLIDEARRVPSIERIAFTGGEPFLLRGELDELVAHATSAGLAARVVTNGYWAVGAAAAHARIAAIRAAGLDEMMLSTGTFHQRFVPAERVVHAARAAVAAGIAVRISVELCDQSATDGTALAEALAPEIASGRLVVRDDPWIPDAGGRGSAAITHETARRDSAAQGRCANVLTMLAVTPSQMLTACCGYPLEELPELRIGSVAEHALDDVLREAPNGLLAMWLHLAGPAGVARFVERHVPGFALPPAASICQACTALQRDPRATAALREHGAEAAPRIAAAFVRAVAATAPRAIASEPVLSPAIHR